MASWLDFLTPGGNSADFLSYLSGPGSRGGDSFLSFLAGPTGEASPFLQWISNFSQPYRPSKPQQTPSKYGKPQGGTPLAPARPDMVEQGVVPRTPTGGAVPTAGTYSSRDEFISRMLPYAVEVEQQTGIPAQVMLAINLNEQGWQLPAPGNNYFGIKAGPGYSGPTTGGMSTWEVVNGQAVPATADFRAYDSPADSYADFARFLQENPRYQYAMEVLKDHQNWKWFVQELNKAGYATDPEWANKIISIASEIGG